MGLGLVAGLGLGFWLALGLVLELRVRVWLAQLAKCAARWSNAQCRLTKCADSPNVPYTYAPLKRLPCTHGKQTVNSTVFHARARPVRANEANPNLIHDLNPSQLRMEYSVSQWLKWFCEAGGSPDEARLEQTPYPFQPTNLALFRHKITLYRFSRGGSYYCRGLKWEQGAEPSSPPHFNHWCFTLRYMHAEF